MTMHQGTAGAVLAVLQSYGLKKERSGRYRSNSPLRPGSNSHALSLLIDDDEHGCYSDFVSGEQGSLYQLAERLGIERPRNDQAGGEKPGKRTYRDLAAYAEAHYAPMKAFEAAGWKMTRQDGRPALAFTTPTGTRYRYLDDQSPKYRSPSGYARSWYRLPEAVALAGDGPLVLCNGEASTVAAQWHGLAATCVTGGEKASLPDDLVAELRNHWAGPVLVAFDADTAGREKGPQLAAHLAAAGFEARAVDLMPGVSYGFDLADFCGLHQGQSAAALSVLSALSDSTDRTEPAPRPRFVIRPESWLETIPPPTWLLENELLAGAFNLVYGASGSGKTFVALDRALRVVAAGHRALYIATEDLPGVRQRVRAWRQHYPERSGQLDILEMPEGVDLAAPSQVDALLEALSGQAYALITIDTLREAHTGDENSSTDMARVNRAIQRIIRTTGAAVEVLHHSGVNDGRERGSTALSANCDLKWKVSNDDGVIEVSCEKFRHGAELETRYFALSPVADSAVTVPTDRRQRRTSSSLTRIQRDILEFLAQSVFAEVGAKGTQIRSALNLPEKSMYRALSSLKDRAYVVQGKKGDPYTVTTSGRAAVGPDYVPGSSAPDTVTPVTALQSATVTTVTELSQQSDSTLSTVCHCHPLKGDSTDSCGDSSETGTGGYTAIPGFEEELFEPEPPARQSTSPRLALIAELERYGGELPREPQTIEELQALVDEHRQRLAAAATGIADRLRKARRDEH